MTWIYGALADLISIVHLAYVLTVVLGLPAFWIGIFLKKPWARNPWLRCGHLAMILIVVFEAWAGITCPLTNWEYDLRVLAQQDSHEGAFIAQLVHRYLFFEAPKWVFIAAYSAFGTLVLISFLFAPPRWRRVQVTSPLS